MDIEYNINFIFNDYKETLKIVNEEKSLIKALGLPKHSCELIGSQIILQNEIGKGVFGTVFAITFPHADVGTRNFVVKRLNVQLEYTSLKTKQQILNYLEKYQLTWEDIKPLQPRQSVIDTFDNSPLDRKVVVVLPSLPCILDEAKEFKKFPSDDYRNPDKIIVPKGSYICSENAYSEYVIGAYLSNLYDSRQCINFFKMFSMFTCKNNDEPGLNLKYYQYIFMDRIDGTALNIFGKKNQNGTLQRYNNVCERLSNYFARGRVCDQLNIINGVYIQTIFAIIAYQEKYKVSHNDLHTENVFVEYINDNTRFKGNYLKNADWFSYGIRGRKVYFPAIPVIVKIGDFGLSVKYSKPIVGDEYVFKTGYWQTDPNTGTWDQNGPWIPDTFTPSYDGLYFSSALAQLISAEFSRGALGNLLSRCLYFMCPEMDPQNPIKYQLHDGYINPANGRPVLQNLPAVKTPLEVFLGPILEMYGQRPLVGTTVYSLGDLL